jgi:Glycosyl hydrolase family 20, catalytic domain
MQRLLLILTTTLLHAASPTPPIRGIHLSAPSADEIPLAVKFIQEALPKEGVNLLVLEVNYRFQFKKRPEVADRGALSLEDIKQLVAACRKAGVRLIPQINLLGHQSWAKNTGALLRAHPEFDETPGKYPGNEGIYCRSYCPLHPAVHEVVFDLIDELAEACEADAFHVGMDEVFLLGEEDCPRCRARDKAELFAAETVILRDHLAKTNRTMWMWGDRLLDGATTGIGKWEASLNQTHGAVRLIPHDIVICDWHYDRALPTTEYFAVEGFPVLAAPWRRPDVALAQLAAIRTARTHATDAIAARMQGVLQTTWGGFGEFAKAYFGEAPANSRVAEAVSCFRALFRELRAQMEPELPATSR